MVHINKNLSFQNIQVSNGDEFINCNLTQSMPHTTMFSGVSGLVFRGCNLINCQLPEDSQCIDCNRASLSFCSHVFPELAARGFIGTCAEVCVHMYESETISIDDKEITFYEYRNTMVE